MGSIGFFTQHEVNLAVGSTRQRERLVHARGLLPAAEPIKGFGQTALLYPEFALAGLIVRGPSPAETGYIRLVKEATGGIYAGRAFRSVADTIRRRLKKGWTLESLVAELAGTHLEALLELHAEIVAVEARLAGDGISIRVEVGRVVGIREGRFTIEPPGERALDATPVNAARARIAVGSWVARESVRLGSSGGELIVPTIPPERLPSDLRERLGEDRDEDFDLDALWDEMVVGTAPLEGFRAVAVPVLEPEREEDAGSGAAVNPAPSHYRISTNPEIYARANSMARRGRARLVAAGVHDAKAKEVAGRVATVAAIASLEGGPLEGAGIAHDEGSPSPDEVVQELGDALAALRHAANAAATSLAEVEV